MTVVTLCVSDVASPTWGTQTPAMSFVWADAGITEHFDDLYHVDLGFFTSAQQYYVLQNFPKSDNNCVILILVFKSIPWQKDSVKRQKFVCSRQGYLNWYSNHYQFCPDHHPLLKNKSINKPAQHYKLFSILFVLSPCVNRSSLVSRTY